MEKSMEVPCEVKVKVAQSCLTHCDPMDCIVPGIFQPREKSNAYCVCVCVLVSALGEDFQDELIFKLCLEEESTNTKCTITHSA